MCASEVVQLSFLCVCFLPLFPLVAQPTPKGGSGGGGNGASPSLLPSPFSRCFFIYFSGVVFNKHAVFGLLAPVSLAKPTAAAVVVVAAEAVVAAAVALLLAVVRAVSRWEALTERRGLDSIRSNLSQRTREQSLLLRSLCYVLSVCYQDFIFQLLIPMLTCD